MKADIIIESNVIFDSIKDIPYKGFIAIKGNKVLEISDNLKEKIKYIGKDTQVLFYEDKLVMPSFIDSHTHLLMGGMFHTFLDLGAGKSEEECAKMCYEYAETREKKKWIIGFNWYCYHWTNQTLPTKKSLDYYFNDIPVVLLNAEAHNAWVNSKALEMCGIDANTPDPFGGDIGRFENGEPSGFLNESAVGLVSKYAFDFTAQEQEVLVHNFIKSANAYGITSIVDVKPYFGIDLGSFEALKEMEDKDNLTLRIHVASNLLGDLDETIENCKKYSSDKIRANLVKQFVDGVIPTHTALMLEAYSNAPYDTGMALNKLEYFEKAICEAHKRGLSVKIHAIGDYANRFTLNCYEKALNLYGPTKSRHAIEHCEYVDQTDIPRFGAMGIIPSIQPEHVGLVPSFLDEPYIDALGVERANQTFPYKSLLESAGVIAIGSDCPVVDNNPFHEINRGITRLHDDQLPEGGWNPSQKLTLTELLKGYTIGSAYGISREEELGTLEPGKFADIVVIDCNLFAMDPMEIRKASVLVTIMDGKIVYQKEDL